jgi:hypothetical protein
MEERLLESEMQLIRVGTDDEELENKLNEEEQMKMTMKAEEVVSRTEEGGGEDDEGVEVKEEVEDAIKLPEEVEELDIKKNNNLEQVLQNGYRMVSNPSSPRFVPIAESDRQTQEIDVNIDVHIEDDEISIGIGDKKVCLSLNDVDGEEDVVIPGSVGYVNRKQLDVLQQLTTLRQVSRAHCACCKYHEKYGTVGRVENQ